MPAATTDGPRRLLAVLLNPPTGDGRTTIKHLAVASQILGGMEVRVANLFAVPTRNLAAIDVAGAAHDGWLAARPVLCQELEAAHEVLLGWGLGGLTGDARQQMRAQIGWLMSTIPASVSSIWTIDGQPRHPSRWHQYVSDRRGRVSGADFEARLAKVLQQTDSGSFSMNMTGANHG
jgi:hypothetical protein